MDGIFEVRIPDNKNGFLGTVRKVCRNDQTLYYCTDFELLLDFRSMNCSKLSYLVGCKRHKTNGTKYVLCDWSGIKEGLRKIRMPNDITQMMMERLDPEIPILKRPIEISRSKIGKIIENMDVEKRIQVLLNFFKSVSDPMEFKKISGLTEDMRLSDFYDFSAVELSSILAPVLNEWLIQKMNAEKQRVIDQTVEACRLKYEYKEQERRQNINIPLPNGSNISLNININFGDKGNDRFQNS